MTINERIHHLSKMEKKAGRSFEDIVVKVKKGTLQSIMYDKHKPSFDVICGILEAYPTLNPRWLMLGENPIFNIETSISAVNDPMVPYQTNNLYDLRNLVSKVKEMKQSIDLLINRIDNLEKNKPS